MSTVTKLNQNTLPYRLLKEIHPHEEFSIKENLKRILHPKKVLQVDAAKGTAVMPATRHLTTTLEVLYHYQIVK